MTHFDKWTGWLLAEHRRTGLRGRLDAYVSAYHFARHHGIGRFESARCNLWLLWTDIK